MTHIFHNRDDQPTTLCGHVDEWPEDAVDFIDGNLPEDRRLWIEDHIAACPDCQARMQAQRAVATIARAVLLESPPFNLEARVLAATRRVASEAGADRTGFWSRLASLGRPRYFAAAAAIAAAAVIAVVGLNADRGDLQNAVPESQHTTSVAVTTLLTTSPPSTLTSGGSEGTTPTDTEAATNTTVGEDAQPQPTTSTSAPGTNATRNDKIALLVDAAETPQLEVSDSVWVAVRPSEERHGDITAFFESITGLEALPPEYWLGGPTYAVIASTVHVNELIKALFDQGLFAGPMEQPDDPYGNALPGLMAGLATYKQMLPMTDSTTTTSPGDTGKYRLSLVVFVLPVAAGDPAQ